MVAIPATSRLPRLLSATTLALVIALFALLVSESRQPERPNATYSFIPPQTNADSTPGWRVREPTAARIVLERHLDSLARSLDSLASTLVRGSMRAERGAFDDSRLAYMRAEALLERYSPSVAHALNGPLESDDADAPARPLGSPAGFQVVLSAIGAGRSDSASADRKAMDGKAARAAEREVAISMRDQLRHLRTQTRYLDVGALPVLESMRTELARLTTVGLAGFYLDDPRNAVREAAASLEGMREIAVAEANAAPATNGERVSRDSWLRIARTLGAASGYLHAHPDFERLDRLALLTRYANPAALAIADARAPLLAHSYPLRRVWRADAATVFERHALDATAFAPDFAPAPTPALIALGARLFSDSRLSGAQDRSCATCHDPARAFTDGRARPRLISAGQSLPRNTPTLLDVAYQPLYFADQRALSLEDQIGAVLASHTEMGSSPEVAALHLSRDSFVLEQFRVAFASSRDDTLDARNLRSALAAYLRSLDSFDSRFDRAARGDSLALTRQERQGFTLFMGKARCGSCHFAPLFSGVMPPDFTSSEPEIIGVATHSALRNVQLDPDSGRAGIDHLAEHLHAFKVPTLRNVAVTAPYMHNGAYSTLDDVVHFYDHGGGAGLGAPLTNSTLPASRLRLSRAERSALIAFLRSLTDTSASRSYPLQRKLASTR